MQKKVTNILFVIFILAWEELLRFILWTNFGSKPKSFAVTNANTILYRHL